MGNLAVAQRRREKLSTVISRESSLQFIDLKTQYQNLKQDIDARIHAVLDHGQYIMGPEVAELEEKLAAFTGSKHCIGVASGTDALLIAMMAAGLKAGDEVITTRRNDCVTWGKTGIR